jgi:serine/threonine-protein kinase MRCK
MELLNLQSSLQPEIQAKQTISEELRKTRSELIAAQTFNSSWHKFEILSHDMKGKESEIYELQSKLELGERTSVLERPSS